MAHIDPPRRIAGKQNDKYSWMGATIDPKDLDGDRYYGAIGQLAAHTDADAGSLLKAWTHETPHRAQLGGWGSAMQYLEDHQLGAELFLRDRFLPDEVEHARYRLRADPQKLRHMVIDHSRPNHEKYGRIVDFIGTEESAIVSVVGGRGEGKSSGLGRIAHDVHEGHDRSFSCFDMRPRHLLYPFARRIVDIRDADRGDIIVLDEVAKFFSNRRAQTRENIMLQIMLAVLRHYDLTALFVAPSAGLMDVTIEKMSDGQIRKPDSLTQKAYSRRAERLIVERVPEMLPRAGEKEWMLFYGKGVQPMTAHLPYRCNSDEQGHTHDFVTCCLAPWWVIEMSKSQAGKRDLTELDVQEIAFDLLRYCRDGAELKDDLEGLAQKMAAGAGAYAALEEWALLLYELSGGRHPLTGREMPHLEKLAMQATGHVGDGSASPRPRRDRKPRLGAALRRAALDPPGAADA